MFEVEATKFEKYVHLVCAGPATLENLKNVVDKIKSGDFENAGVRKYLVDLRPIDGTIGTFERYELGKHIADSVPGLRIAAISKKESYNKVGENVAVNRGANILATDDEHDAMVWLLSE